MHFFFFSLRSFDINMKNMNINNNTFLAKRGASSPKLTAYLLSQTAGSNLTIERLNMTGNINLNLYRSVDSIEEV